MKYYLIVGEASGDLHASHLMAALKAEDPQADFRFFGGDLMLSFEELYFKRKNGEKFVYISFYILDTILLPRPYLCKYEAL